MLIPFNTAVRLLLVLCAGMLTACAEEPEPAYYLLAPEGGPAAVVSASQPAERIIGLRELALPLYARRTQIATIGPDGAVTLSDDHRWAEEVPRAASRVVARTMSETTGRTVFIEPWPQGTDPSVRVDVEVDFMAGRLGGEFRLEGQYRIVPADGGAALSNRFSFVEQANGPGYEALVDSHRRALAALAQILARELSLAR